MYVMRITGVGYHRVSTLEEKLKNLKIMKKGLKIPNEFENEKCLVPYS